MKMGQVALGVALGVLGSIALAPIMGAYIPESIWGIAVGAMASLVGTLVPASEEKFEIKHPVNYKAEIKYSAQE